MRDGTECRVQDTRHLALDTHVDCDCWLCTRLSLHAAHELVQGKVVFDTICLPNDLDDVAILVRNTVLGLHRLAIPAHIPAPIVPRRNDLRVTLASNQVKDVLLRPRDFDVDVLDAQSHRSNEELKGLLLGMVRELTSLRDSTDSEDDGESSFMSQCRNLVAHVGSGRDVRPQLVEVLRRAQEVDAQLDGIDARGHLLYVRQRRRDVRVCQAEEVRSATLGQVGRVVGTLASDVVEEPRDLVTDAERRWGRLGVVLC